MCVRTKTSYGCGHVFKTTNDCDTSRCSVIDRYHYMKEGDCGECRSGGSSVTRGREGKGRYAQKLKRSKAQERASSSSEEISTAEYDVSGGASPWAPQNRQEKMWESPHRKRADEAWLSEHEDRVSDLQERLEQVSFSERRQRPKYTKELALDSESDRDDDHDDHDEDEDEDEDEDDQDEYEYAPIETPSRRPRQIEVRRRLDDRPRPEAHSHRQSHSQRDRDRDRDRDRQHSHDSLPDSMPSYRSSPKLKKAATYHVSSDRRDAYDYDYDYYGSKPVATRPSRRHTHQHSSSLTSRAKTEPYPYRHDSDYDYDLAPGRPPPLPLQMSLPASAIYDSFYSPNGSPAAPYTISDYRYETDIYSPPPPPPPPRPRPQHYVDYRRY